MQKTIQGHTLCFCGTIANDDEYYYSMKKGIAITDHVSGELICSKCGMVYDKREEWNRTASPALTIKDNKNKTTVMDQHVLYGQSIDLYSTFTRTDRDAKGKKLNNDMRMRFKRLGVWDYRINNNYALIKPKVILKLYQSKEKLCLSDAILEKSAYLFIKAHRVLIRGRTIDGILMACVYIACREAGNTRTLSDIALISGLKRRDIAKNYRRLIRELDIKVPAPDPMKCVSKIANNLNLPEKTKQRAISMMEEILNRNLALGKNPMSFAAVVIYLSCMKTGETITQNRISDVCGLTEVTLRNRMIELRMHGVG